MAEFLDVDPRTLHLPQTRPSGADPIKLTRQLSQYGRSTTGMPPIEVNRDGAGRLKIMDGVTRATRVAKWLPGQTVTVEVTEDHPHDDYAHLPTVGDRLP
jgi:hypothetical protein